MAPRNSPSTSPNQPPQPPPPVVIVLPPLVNPTQSYLVVPCPKPKSRPSLSSDDIIRLHRAYPNLVRVPTTLVADGAKPWSFSLVCKFLSHTLSAEKVTSSFLAKWNPVHEWEIISMNYGYFLFRFTAAQDRDAILNGGPWIVDDATLALEPWMPMFVPSPNRLPRTVLWMRLPDLPSVCWNRAVLELIVATGRFIRIDDSTSLLAKGRFARVTVEIDTANPLVLGTDFQLEGT